MQAGEKSALVGHGAIIAARRGEKEGPDGRSENAGKPTTSTPEPHRWCREVANLHSRRPAPLVSLWKARRSTGCAQRA
jgi:hypothetical protein